MEMSGSSARETFVRSTYEIVYMINATGMMRSQRCEGAVNGFAIYDIGFRIGGKPIAARALNAETQRRGERRFGVSNVF